MSTFFEQFGSIFKSMPVSQKLASVIILLLVVFGFAGIYLYGQKADYQPLFGKLSADDAALIVEKLREQRVPFQIEGGGSLVMVPAEKVYDVRLSLAGMGLPKGGTVGFEIFDETDFGTTEFVQKLNYQRALQGELARTIREFNEVADARVMIVMAKNSVFIEESKPPSASVMLKLRAKLSKSKVAAVVNLVSSAVEDMTPALVTVVDTDGNVLSKKTSEADQVGDLADSQLEYKMSYERNMARRIQTMLERIVGDNKAIVRVAADMDFNQVDLSEEIYDPDGQVVRSRQRVTESLDSSKGAANGISSVNPVGAAGSGKLDSRQAEKSQKQNETINYEINRTIRRTVKPIAEIKRVSVAAVLDGNYTMETDKNGHQTRTFVPRTPSELEQFGRIVQNAMGYNADREDQVSVESVPFSYMKEMEMAGSAPVNWGALLKRYGHILAYVVLIGLAFMFLVKPIMKSVQEVSVRVEQAALTHQAQNQGVLSAGERQALPEPPPNLTGREKATFLAKQNMDKTTDQVKGWLSEEGA
ncbi:MAG: flagellar M-ring protein FliF [Deltaproteobacteria bacterium]|nr:flagellar M-ring protein FliF [Deltaproteobacteria bacterium]